MTQALRAQNPVLSSRTQKEFGMAEWFHNTFPLLVNLTEHDVQSTLTTMGACLLLSVILLAMAYYGSRDGHYCLVEHYMYIAGFALLAVMIATAIVGAPIILYVGKWALIVGAVLFSINIIYKAAKDFIRRLSPKESGSSLS